MSSREYQSWRESGVAFSLRDDAPYDQPNRTLASGLLLKQVTSSEDSTPLPNKQSCTNHLLILQGGERMARRGYWGDIVNSPFISLGIESENKDLFKTANDKHIKVRVRVCSSPSQHVRGTC